MKMSYGIWATTLPIVPSFSPASAWSILLAWPNSLLLLSEPQISLLDSKMKVFETQMTQIG
jgi:hypothetical protein